MKTNNLHKVLLLAIGVFATSITFAQFKVDAQFRDRFEARNGYQKLTVKTDTPAVFISQRTRLTFSYETENLKLKFSPQDVRTWGDEEVSSFSGGNGNHASIDLFEGYAEFKAYKNLWASVGRQQIVYDNNSLLSNGNWNQNGSTVDALILKYKKDDLNLHIAGSWNNDTVLLSDNYYPSDRIKTLNYIWFNNAISKNLKYSLIHVTSGVTKSETNNAINFRHTTGLFANYATDSLNILGNFYYQYGKNTKATKVSAYLADLDISYKTKTVTPGIGLSYLSGNSKVGAAQTTDNLFDPLYRSRHGYFGNIDYFSKFDKHTKGGGLADYFAYLDVKLSKNLSFRNTAHTFQLAQTNANTPTDKKLGFENDLIVKYKFSDVVNLETGYLFYLPTESLRKIQGITNDELSQFLYVQLTITPTIFKQ